MQPYLELIEVLQHGTKGLNKEPIVYNMLPTEEDAVYSEMKDEPMCCKKERTVQDTEQTDIEMLQNDE